MRQSKVAYLLLTMGILILTLSPIAGSSINSKMAGFYGLHQTNKITAEFIENSNSQGNSLITFENIRQLSEYELKDYDLAYALAALTTVSTSDSASSAKRSQSQVQVQGVSAGYREFHQIPLVSGCFLASGQEEEAVAVIDEQLAENLFQNSNVVGLELEIYGRKFKIVGVAEKDPSMLGSITDRETGTVFIPVKKLLELKENSGITFLEAAVKESGTTGSNTALLEKALSSIGQDPARFKIIDYNLEQVFLEQKDLLRDFLTGFIAIVILLSFLKRIIRDIHNFLNLRLQEYYLLEILKKDRLPLLTALAKALLLLTGICLLWQVIRFPLYIPPEYIPSELTDISYWADLMRSGIQANFQGMRTMTPFGEEQLAILRTIQNWNSILSLILGLPLSGLGLYLLQDLKEEGYKLALFSSVIMLSALIIGTLLLLIINMPLAIGTRGILLVYITMFLSVIRFTGGSEADGGLTIKKYL